jgi:hypothetical protein
MKKTMFILAACAALALGETKTITGVITDTMCGLNHKHMGATDEAKCVRDCVKGGRWKYAIHDGKKMYELSDQKTPEQFAAQKVRVTGNVDEQRGFIEVVKIEAAAK